MRKLSKAWIASVAALGLLGFGCAQADLVVIVHASNTVSSLTADDVSRIYLGKTKTFPDGANVIPIDQAEGAAPRDKFYTEVVKKNRSQLKSYWSRVIFTGKGQPPQQEADDTAVKEIVAKNPSLIGYVDSKVVDGSVKVVLSIPL